MVPAVTAPARGLNVGVEAGARIVYVADATPEAANPGAVAMALMVVAALMAMGAVYCVDDGPGSVPSVVKWIVAPAVVVLIETVVPVTTAPAAGLNVGVAAAGIRV